MAEAWQQVWRDGLAPSLSDKGLQVLREALRRDDRRLIQASVTYPPPLHSLQSHAVEGACSLGYCGWQGEGLETGAEVEEYFAQLCCEADQRLGEPAACRWFLNWFDDTPRDDMRRFLLAEVERSLAQRLGMATAEALPSPSAA